jgi:serine/threonine-protein kinase
MNFGRYKVIREIGKGAMGVVYLAHDPNLDLQVALKVLRQDRVVAESFTRRFLAEARAPAASIIPTSYALQRG